MSHGYTPLLIHNKRYNKMNTEAFILLLSLQAVLAVLFYGFKGSKWTFEKRTITVAGIIAVLALLYTYIY